MQNAISGSFAAFRMTTRRDPVILSAAKDPYASAADRIEGEAVRLGAFHPTAFRKVREKAPPLREALHNSRLDYFFQLPTRSMPCWKLTEVSPSRSLPNS